MSTLLELPNQKGIEMLNKKANNLIVSIFLLLSVDAFAYDDTNNDINRTEFIDCKVACNDIYRSVSFHVRFRKFEDFTNTTFLLRENGIVIDRLTYQD